MNGVGEGFSLKRQADHDGVRFSDSIHARQRRRKKTGVKGEDGKCETDRLNNRLVGPTQFLRRGWKRQ